MVVCSGNGDIDTVSLLIENGADVSVQPDWNATTGKSVIQNRPELSTKIPLEGASDNKLATEKAVSDAMKDCISRIWTY